MRGRLIIVVLAVVAVGIALFTREGGGDGAGQARAPDDSLAVSFAYSPEKEELLTPLIERFNDQQVEVGGQPVFIEGRSIASGEAETEIAEGRLQPVAWSPASSLWGRLLNFHSDRGLAPRENPSIVRTPLVIAMWEPMARALGWPRQNIGFDDLLEVVRSGRGWGEYGHPEFGDFKLVHTNPDFSTSGLSAVVAEYYAATGKRRGLTERDVQRSEARSTVRDLQRSIVHYGDTTLFIAEQMRQEGPGYASAALMEEVTLLDFNRNRGDRERLVAIYPKEGTFYSDNPFIVLNADWVSEEQAQGAEAFQRFLSEEITPERAAESGFRPAAADTEPVAPIVEENGVDPSKPERVLDLPDPRVLAAIRRAWTEDRKPSNILLVVDVSGSMNQEGRMERAKQGLEVFFEQVARQDRVGLLAFSDELRPLVGIGHGQRNRRRLERAVRGLVPYGGTAFFDATVVGVRQVRELAGPDRINAVVLLTDGEDTDSRRDLDDVVADLRAEREAEDRVRVFTIAYSPEAEGAREALEAIADASGGRAYVGDTDDIRAVYRSISSFF
jgi:Ca-activated chloride channel homolog